MIKFPACDEWLRLQQQIDFCREQNKFARERHAKHPETPLRLWNCWGPHPVITVIKPAPV